jgi:ADP-ribose pyrophosphatase YjhB (NUDIX family)
MTASFASKFFDGNNQPVQYDGSVIEWRISVYGVCVRDGKLLVIKHQADDYHDLPGGGVNLHEEFPQALLREGVEEAGYELEMLEHLDTTEDWVYLENYGKYFHAVRVVYLAKIVGGDGKPTDPGIRDVQFIPLDKLDTIQLYPNVLAALRIAKSRQLI